MKRFLLPVLAAALLSTSACSNADTAKTGTTTPETAGGNAGDNAMNNATKGDAPTATMPANANDPGNAATDAGSAKMDNANATDGKMADGSAGAADGAMGDPNGPTAPHKDDKEFMMSAAHSDQNEIQQSKMALSKGVTGMAKDMANKMIADHTKSTADLKKIAAKKGVTLPTDMDAEHKAMKPAMEKLSGKAFEAKYLTQMDADHQKTANTMMAHEKMTQDADVKGFIGKTLPVVQQHLAMAKKGESMKM